MSSNFAPPHLLPNCKAASFLGTSDELIDASSAKGHSLTSSSPFQLMRAADLSGDTPIVGLALMEVDTARAAGACFLPSDEACQQLQHPGLSVSVPLTQMLLLAASQVGHGVHFTHLSFAAHARSLQATPTRTTISGPPCVASSRRVYIYT